ncbi:MAG TPA: ROK family protein [Acidobacteriaceae bacterium]|jgi:fructokinase|nr:ROK family protein [Acidobacteriaceae bacterium]
MERRIRIGIDLGGTKIEGLAMDEAGTELARLRIPTPQHDYQATVQAIAEVVGDLERRIDGIASDREKPSVGVGIPGTIVRATGLVKNANSTWLNGQPLEHDLAATLGRPVRCANDANCLAVSEATDGAAAGAELEFAVILGTGCGGGVALNGKVHIGPNGVSGEWGHNPLPWASEDELPGAHCYCGQCGCLETWISGTGLARDHCTLNPSDGKPLTGPEIVTAAEAGDQAAQESLTRLEWRIARALASVVNMLDPDVIVIGGGLSKLDRIYRNVPPLIARHVFGGGDLATPVRKAMHGDASGVRGAAWLWEK